LSYLLGGAAALALVFTTPAHAEKVVVSTTKATAASALFIGKEMGRFAEQGLEVEFKFFDAAQPVAVAVVSRDADVGVTGLTGGFYNMAGKSALKMVGGGAREEPGYSFSAYVVSKQAYDAGFHKPQQVVGKSFGITQVGSPFHYCLIMLANKYGFPLSAVKTVPLQSFSGVAAALKGGSVDGGLLISTVAIPLDRRGDAKIIGWVGDETPWQVTAVFVTVDTTAKRREMVSRFLTAYRKAAAEFDEVFQKRDAQGKPIRHPKEGEMLKIVTAYTNLPAEQARQSFPYIDRNVALPLEEVRRQIADWKKVGLVDANVDAESIVDTSFSPVTGRGAR
jgi:NitT/TauT family transport system substrate-binding protein